MYVDIQELPVNISPETIGAILAHRAFCLSGTDWLGKYDPKCKLEAQLIEQVDARVQGDCEGALNNLMEFLHYACHEGVQFSILDKDDYWPQLEKLTN
jgi:hypothetical protein